MNDEEVNSPFIEYRADMNRVADMLDAAAELPGRMRARVPKGVKIRHRSHCYNARLTVAGAGVLVDPSTEENQRLMKRESQHVLHVNDGIYVSPRLDMPKPGESETAYWFRKRAWQIRICGRSAVGVGLARHTCQSGSPDKVYHATCKDRLCPACNARILARAAPALKRLLREELSNGERVFFATLTVQHNLRDSLLGSRAVLDGGWGRLIRTKWFRETFGERLRCAEVEYTSDNGWHPHFHLLLRMDRSCKAWHWSHDRVERELKRLWERSTTREGRKSFQVDLRELQVDRDADGAPRRDKVTGEIESVRYWLRLAERARYLKLEKQGKVKLIRRHGQLYRVQTLHDVVEELCKYVTKRQADGLKPNQVSMWDWTPAQLQEYAIGIRYWNLRRASKGWEQLLIEFKEEEQLAREIEDDELGGYEYYAWAQIIEQCKRAAEHKLTRQEGDKFTEDYPRILRALEDGGCDISADMIRGHIFRFFGDLDAPLQRLRVKPWELKSWRDEKTARAILELAKHSEEANALQRRYKARHWRVLVKLRRQHDRGITHAKVTGLGMSRKRTADVVGDLERDGLLREIDLNGKPRFELTDEGRRLLPTTLKDPRERHKRRKAVRDLQRTLPGLMVQEDDRDG